MDSPEVNMQQVELSDIGEREITVEILHEKEGMSVANTLTTPMNVKIERVPRGFKVITSIARCM